MTDQAMSPLRRRMIEDMTIRKFAQKTQHDYVQRVKKFAAFLGRSPATAKLEDVRRYRLHLASSGAGTPTINGTVATLRFFFNVTLDRADLAKHLSFVHEPRKMPVVLSPEEVVRFLEAAPSIKYKAALSVAYGAGLRDDEAGSDLADDPKRFTGCKGANFTEPTYPLDFHWIELGKHLIAPLFANRLHLQRHLASAGT
jgi:integrase/recombinase XerD